MFAAAKVPSNPVAANQNGLHDRGARRFGRVAITSAFGDPLHIRTWSGAPRRLADALTRLGVEVVGIQSRLSPAEKMMVAGLRLLRGLGVPPSTEHLLRAKDARRRMARRTEREALAQGADAVLHTGTLDMPGETTGLAHYIYCDQSWGTSWRYRPDSGAVSARTRRHYDEEERAAFAAARHVFTFGRYVADGIVSHYGLAAEKVGAVGSGMGEIAPYTGPKDYTRPELLFVAKHYFREKGGEIVVRAVLQALRERPDIHLTIVGGIPKDLDLPAHPNIKPLAYISWEELQGLYRGASLLVQPMLNDPWGQVYLEALISRTPVLGLARNGLPEIVADGRAGFLVEQTQPAMVAEAILNAISNPERLAEMGSFGQAHVMASYNWDEVARRILYDGGSPPNLEETGVTTPDQRRTVWAVK